MNRSLRKKYCYVKTKDDLKRKFLGSTKYGIKNYVYNLPLYLYIYMQKPTH